MRYFYSALEKDLSSIYHNGIKADQNGDIKIIILKEGFLMDKFLFDVYADEVLNVDIYCLFIISEKGIRSELIDRPIDHIFSGAFKILKQDHIETEYLSPYISDVNYEGMGLEPGVLPVENRDKFTPDFKQKILEYLKALD
ncbi:MAG: hypothetical protein GY765_10925 [bacterium]|nr:hypothetical protein [bacterium]